MLVMVLRRQRVSGRRHFVHSASSAAIDPAVGGRKAWLMNDIEIIRVAVLERLWVLVQCHVTLHQR